MEPGSFREIPRGRILEDDNLRIVRVLETCQRMETRTNWEVFRVQKESMWTCEVGVISFQLRSMCFLLSLGSEY